jgi:RHS repeat-associated protein
VETVAGSLVSTKQFVWNLGSMTPSEVRDVGSAIVAQYFDRGQTIGGTTSKYSYTKDHLGSVRDLTDSGGSVQAQYAYDVYGQKTKLQGSNDSDFQYAGYYFHAPSQFNFTTSRAYLPNLGRWINRDPAAEHGGINLYGYVLNKPLNRIDSSGLDGFNIPFPMPLLPPNGPGGPLADPNPKLPPLPWPLDPFAPEPFPWSPWVRACDRVKQMGLGPNGGCCPIPPGFPGNTSPAPDPGNMYGEPPYTWPGSPPWNLKQTAPYNGYV